MMRQIGTDGIKCDECPRTAFWIVQHLNNQQHLCQRCAGTDKKTRAEIQLAGQGTGGWRQQDAGNSWNPTGKIGSGRPFGTTKGPEASRKTP